MINVLLKKKKQKQMKIKLEFIIKISEECRQRNKIRIFHFFCYKNLMIHEITNDDNLFAAAS